MINISENNWVMDWDKGTPEVALLSVGFAVFLGLPLLLSRPEFLGIGSVIFYLFLFIIGFFGHVDDVTGEKFQKVEKDDVVLAIGIGLIGFLIIQAMFFIGLTLLATAEGTLTMTKWDLLIFNLTFVIAGEELVFRDTLPFIISQGIMAMSKEESENIEKLSIAIGFVVSSVLFGAWHIWTYGFELLAVVKAIVAGIILSVIRVIGGLLASYIAHMAYNSINIMGLIILPF